jgi:hypothetical protein
VVFVVIWLVIVAMVPSSISIPGYLKGYIFHRNRNKNDICVQFLAPHVVKQYLKL